MSEQESSADYDAPRVGDIYRWSGDPSLTIEVIKVGRKNATIRVGSVPGSGWIKPQPMPFPDSFTRVTAPGAIHANGCNVEHSDAGGCQRVTSPVGEGQADA